MEPIKVAVHGVFGKMGREVVGALCRASSLEPVGAVSRQATEDYLSLPDGSGLIPLSTDLAEIISRCRPQVVVDFTNAEAAAHAIRTAAPAGVNVVTGTTGFSEAALKEVEDLAQRHGVGVIVAPNFALGAVLLMHLARQAARFFDYADVTEMHHEAKVDAPSGTALALARVIIQGKGGSFTAPQPEKETLKGTRGGQLEGVTIHSRRMPGLMAHHELVFGAQGQTLTLRHDSMSRESFMPGVIMAVEEVVKSKGPIMGLEKVLGL